eukprot:15691339-Heterocapsa_arctica.AAC.1
MRASLLTRTPVNDQSQDAVLRDGELLHYVYVDNVCVMGADPMLVNAAMDEVVESLESVGLHTHERSVATPLVEALGVELDGEGRLCGVATKRYCRLEAGLRWTLKRRCVTGEQLE